MEVLRPPKKSGHFSMATFPLHIKGKSDILYRVKQNDLKLTAFFGLEDVMPQCGQMSRDDIVRKLVSGLAERHGLPGGEELVKSVLDREQCGSTVIIDGLAVPHARIEGLKQPYAAVATSERGIDWPDEGGGKVHIVFLMLIPRDDPALYLKVLRVLGEVLDDPADLKLVSEMASAGEVLRFLESGKAYLPRFLTAADIMTNDFGTLRDDGTLQTCISALISEHTSELPVVDAAGNLKGVVRADKLLRACIPEHILWMDDLPSILDFEPFAQVLDNEHNTPLTTIMDDSFPVVSPGSPAVQVACEMMKHKSSKCYVRDEGRLVGIVKQTEFLNKIFRE